MSDIFEDLKEIKITEVKEISKDGKKFKAFKTIAKNGAKMDVKFVQTCTNVPTDRCIIYVKRDNANVDTRRQYPVLWIKEVEKIEPMKMDTNIDLYF